MKNRRIELDDGVILAEYDPATGEVLDACDWHGNELSHRNFLRVEDAIADEMADAAEAKLER